MKTGRAKVLGQNNSSFAQSAQWKIVVAPRWRREQLFSNLLVGFSMTANNQSHKF
jgi:hypothetical protein